MDRMASTTSRQHCQTVRAVSSRGNGRPASESSDDYLKVILELSGPEERQVASTDVAVRLGISGASATGMLQKLSSTDPRLVIYEKHHGARLTEAGRKRALEIVRHHRLLE